MCLFDHARLPAALIDHALATHPSVHFPGRLASNPVFEPSASAARVPQADQLESKLRALQQ